MKEKKSLLKTNQIFAASLLVLVIKILSRNKN